MEAGRDREGFKHVCKLCNKRYPSGKSLGGHMRSHVMANSHKNKLAQKNKAPPFVADDDEYEDGDEDDDEIADQERENGGGHSGYVLRENPKKTWRVVDSRLKNKLQQNQQQDRICKQCGKGFQSLKALCGHMSCHSEKDRNFKVEDDHSWSSENNSDDNPNHSKSLSSKRLTRSSISRYMQSSFTAAAGSSSNSEIDQHEQEEVAMSLMMLSRDSSSPYKTCFNLVTAESSDNNSVILEGGSISNHGVRKDLNLVSDCDKIKIKINKRVGVFGSGRKVNVPLEMDNSDSGYFENGAKELESDVSNDGFLRNYDNHEFKKPKFDSGSGLVNPYEDYSKKGSRDVGNFRFDSPESEENSSKKIKQDNFECHNNQKRRKFECLICNKMFETHQALRSHITTHRKNGDNSLSTKPFESCSARNLGAVANTTTTTKTTMPTHNAKKGNGSKKLKAHKCPYCPKVFKSGQALGGHKRSHMMGGGGGTATGGSLDGKSSYQAPPPPPEPEQKQPMIDLNLPAPVEEEVGGTSHFVSPW